MAEGRTITNIEEWWSARQLGQVVDLSTERIYQLIRAGELDFVETAHGFLLEPGSVSEFIARRARLAKRGGAAGRARFNLRTSARASGRVHATAEPARERVSA